MRSVELCDLLHYISSMGQPVCQLEWRYGQYGVRGGEVVPGEVVPGEVVPLYSLASFVAMEHLVIGIPT